jgi:hypothetical protein
MPRLAPIQPTISPTSTAQESAQDTTDLALTYLHWFRRIVVVLAVAGAAISFAQQWSALGAACVCIGIGEWLECSYYLNVLRWRQDRAAAADAFAGSPADSSGACGSSQATTTSTSTVSSTPTKTV